MANQIILKKSSVAAKVPLVGDLAYGEVALNYQDGKLYYKKADNTIDSFLSATAGVSSFNTRTGAITLTSSDVTAALGYTPVSTTGTGAAGTWGISVTGSANTLATARTLTIGATGKTFNGSANVSWTLDELQAEYRQPANTVRDNLGGPTVREMALFHGQFSNKLRFIPATLQEESSDGTTWVTSTRATANQLADLMLGEGQSTSFNAIPSAAVGTYGAYRLTWDVVGQTGYVFLNNLYFYNSTNGNNVTVLIEAYHNTNGWTTITGPHTFSNWPGHTTVPHTSIPYSAAAAQYSKVRISFTTTHNANINTFQLYGVEWFGGYPAGKRNVESYDRNKNVTFPAGINAGGGLYGTTAELTSSASQQLRLTYSSGIYSDIKTDVNGYLNLSPSGGRVVLTSAGGYLDVSAGTILLGTNGFSATGDILFRSSGAPSSTINAVFKIKDSTGALQDGLRFNNVWINSTPGSLSNRVDISSLGISIASITSTASSVSTQLNGALSVTGTVSHAGLVPTDGTAIDQIKTITKSLTMTTDWQDAGINSTDLATGTYMVQLVANDTGSGGTNNNEYYSGTMSWYSGDTNSAMELPTDEITLHRAGGSGDGALYLRTYRTPTADANNLKLQIYSNTANASAANYVFKFRRII